MFSLSGLESGIVLERISSSVEVVAGLLAIAITVVAIVVELAANRYTPRITQLFLSESINRVVLGFFVLTTVVCLWLSAVPEKSLGYPRGALLLAMGMVTACLFALLPYFAFLFRFLAPRNIIARIRAQALDAAPRSRETAIEAVAELEDIARRARQQRDRGIAMAAVEALDEVMKDSLEITKDLPAAWFALDRELLRDPDFVALAPASRREIEEQGLWFETKIFRQYLSLFEESLGVDRDLGNLIALNTREVSGSHRAHKPALSDLCIKFFNSYLRCAIRKGEMRSAYYVLHQYRGMAEDLLRDGNAEGARRIAQHMRYYGHFAFETGQSFLLEVVANDLAVLVECAAESAVDEVDALVREFLEVDRESRLREGEEESRLRGVRRAQVKLATFFMERGELGRARQIWEDMKVERLERLRAVREELESDQPEAYWEFTDRGSNFAYLSPARRAHLPEFFSWFEVH